MSLRILTLPILVGVLLTSGAWIAVNQASAAGLATQAVRSRPVIKGTVGPGMTITVSRHRAPHGRYRLVVRDRSSEHNWHIKGPGVNRRTSVAGTGRTVWRVHLVPGRYRIRCDVHPTTMRTRLRVH